MFNLSHILHRRKESSKSQPVPTLVPNFDRDSMTLKETLRENRAFKDLCFR